MKVKMKKQLVVTTAKRGVVAKVIAAAKSKVAKAGKIIGRFYVQLRGTPLNLGNLRAADFAEQAFTAPVIGGAPAILIANGKFGTTVSTVTAKGHVVGVDKQRGFDVRQLKTAHLVSVPAAASEFRKRGTAHTIKHKGKEVAGYILGNLADMYVGFYATHTKAFMTLETRALPGKRNADRLFSLVK